MRIGEGIFYKENYLVKRGFWLSEALESGEAKHGHQLLTTKEVRCHPKSETTHAHHDNDGDRRDKST